MGCIVGIVCQCLLSDMAVGSELSRDRRAVILDRPLLEPSCFNNWVFDVAEGAGCSAASAATMVSKQLVGCM